MKKPGPPPKPTALKKLQGNPGKRPLNQAEPMPHISSRTPPVPDWLNDDAKVIWKQYARKLWELQLLTDLDVLAFGAFCMWMAVYIKAMRKADLGGEIQVAEKSGWRNMDAWMIVASNAWGHASKIASHFGMTPADRAKLRIESIEKELSLAEELFQLTN